MKTTHQPEQPKAAFTPGGRMRAFEILFYQTGNTVVGDYSLAEKIYTAKPKMFPFGKVITCDTEQDARRLV